MSNFTKCDLSAGVAKLDLEKLTNQIEIHFFGTLEKMQKLVSDVRNDCLTPEGRAKGVNKMVAHGSDDVTRLAKQIGETAELLSTLNGAKEREKIEIIRPE